MEGIRQDSVLRIQKGPALGRGQEHLVYVLQNGAAVEREIVTGLEGEVYVEVLDGLYEGDRVLLSGISSLENVEVVELK